MVYLMEKKILLVLSGKVALLGGEICPGFALIGSQNKQYTIQETHIIEHDYRLDNPPLWMKNVSLSDGNTT